MPPQSLPRSYKRKYKKLHAQFTATQGSTALLQDDLKDAVAIALRLLADNDMLLDLLYDVVPPKRPMPPDEQLTKGVPNQSSLANDLSSGYDDLQSEEVDSFYAASVPDHFESVPWDLDRVSFSGSHIEDLARAAKPASANQAHGLTETPAQNTASARKAIIRQYSSKKRERLDGDEVNGAMGGKKKKRKSMAVSNSDLWES